MKKLLIPFVVGAVLGLGGSTVAVGFFGGGDASLTESLAAATAESGHVEAEHADSAAAEAAMTDSIVHDSNPDLHLGDSITVLPGSDSTAVELNGAASAGVPPAQTSMEPARLAKLFASMQAREAARVLEHMDDYEIQIILTQLGNREAAAILSNLKPERAALISRTVIRGERSNP